MLTSLWLLLALVTVLALAYVRARGYAWAAAVAALRQAFVEVDDHTLA